MRCGFCRWLAAGSETLAELCQEARFDPYQCTTLLNLGEYQWLQVEAPNVLQGELKATIRRRIKNFFYDLQAQTSNTGIQGETKLLVIHLSNPDYMIRKRSSPKQYPIGRRF